jgi:hypothetical protein
VTAHVTLTLTVTMTATAELTWAFLDVVCSCTKAAHMTLLLGVDGGGHPWRLTHLLHKALDHAAGLVHEAGTNKMYVSDHPARPCSKGTGTNGADVSNSACPCIITQQSRSSWVHVLLHSLQRLCRECSLRCRNPLISDAATCLHQCQYGHAASVCKCWQLAVSPWRKLYQPVAADVRPTNHQWHMAATVGAPDSGGTCLTLASTDCSWIQLAPHRCNFNAP